VTDISLTTSDSHVIMLIYIIIYSSVMFTIRVCIFNYYYDIFMAKSVLQLLDVS